MESRGVILKSVYSLPHEDLEFILSKTERLWDELRGKRLFLTGGSGFFGTWLLESFAYANEKLGLDATLVVLTRRIDATEKKLPHIFQLGNVYFQEGDVRSFDFPLQRFSHIIHAATAAGTESLDLDPLQSLDTILTGTRRVLNFARTSGVEKFLYLSSGAVYGTQSPNLSHVTEEYLGAPDPLDLKATYGHSKRMAEHLAVLCGKQFSFEVKIARPFAFMGPYLPLDAAFAAGNFLGNILSGKPIEILGDGTPMRSYLYAADLTVWLWTILFAGPSGRAYNVGSEEAMSISDLARVMVSLIPSSSPTEIRIARNPIEGVQAVRYVPSTQRAQTELHLQQTYSLVESIEKMMRWYRSRRENGTH
jgi:nucleoside-diphosphate-sugar epimerase